MQRHNNTAYHMTEKAVKAAHCFQEQKHVEAEAYAELNALWAMEIDPKTGNEKNTDEKFALRYGVSFEYATYHIDTLIALHEQCRNWQEALIRLKAEVELNTAKTESPCCKHCTD